MLADDVRGIAQDLGHVFERAPGFEQFRCERMPETMRMSASDTGGFEHRGERPGGVPDGRARGSVATPEEISTSAVSPTWNGYDVECLHQLGRCRQLHHLAVLHGPQVNFA